MKVYVCTMIDDPPHAVFAKEDDAMQWEKDQGSYHYFYMEMEVK